MKLCSRRLMVFGQNFCEKPQISVPEPYFGKRTTLVDRLLESHGQLSIALVELFRYLLRFRSYEAKCVQLSCFHRGSTSCTQILPGKVVSTILGVKKLETLGYPMVKTASFCIPSFRHNTGV